ncbi:MAG: phosphatidate cytidylyltransferase [Pseudomonadota bacterium]
MADAVARSTSELVLRLISAAVLIPVALLMVWIGGVWLALGCAFFAMAMAYEWVRMSASPLMKQFLPLAALPVLIAAVVGPLFGVISLLFCAALAGGLHPLARERILSAIGLAYVAGMPLALFMLRTGPWDGAAAALIIMGLVWGSDSAAYFTGKSIGGPKLSPDSPSKTWSGAIGAVIFTSLCAILAAVITGGHFIIWPLVGFVVSVFAQMGDLAESRIKRHYGVKDASSMIPGHGGVLDRVDGLGIVCVIAVFAFYATPNLTAQLGLLP